MDLFDTIREIGSAFADLGRGLCDVHEYATKGFVEEVIKGNGSYKTSYEKQAEADAIISRENRRQKEAAKLLNSSIEALNTRIKQLNERKQKILNGILRFSAAGTINAQVNERFGASDYNTLYPEDIIVEAMGGGNSLLGMNMRIAHSDEYLEQAKEYISESNVRIAQMNAGISRIATLNSVLDEEEKLLDVLEISVSKNRPLKYHLIADKLNKLIAEHLIGADGTSNYAYINSLHALEDLCRMI